MTITFSSLLIWLLIGLIAGWLAGEVTTGHGFGLLGNIIIGMIGAFLGGFLLSTIGLDPGGFVGEVVQAFIGALALLALLSVVRTSRLV